MPTKFHPPSLHSAEISPSNAIDRYPEDFIGAMKWSAVVHNLSLSERESAIAALLLRGHSQPQIAAEMKISVHTVHTHLERLYRKLGVHSGKAVIAKLFQVYVETSQSQIQDKRKVVRSERREQ